jgi:rod shape-determining protein MreD
MIGVFRRRDRFAPPPSEFERQAIPVASVVLASLTPLLPIVATVPLLPPFGLLTLLAWRLLRSDLWPVWAALPLGLFDDLLSGAPIGTAAAGWTLALLAIEVIDRRLVWRDHWQDWGIAILLTVLVQLLALGLSTIAGGATSPLLLAPQFAIAALAFPFITRICAGLDRARFAR